MGHDSECAAIIYQHAARGADQAIPEAMDAHVEAQQANCTLIAQMGLRRAGERKAPTRLSAVNYGFVVERGTGIEPRTISLGIRQLQPVDRPDLGGRHTASDRYGPCDTRVNGPPMARGPSWVIRPSPCSTRDGLSAPLEAMVHAFTRPRSAIGACGALPHLVISDACAILTCAVTHPRRRSDLDQELLLYRSATSKMMS